MASYPLLTSLSTDTDNQLNYPFFISHLENTWLNDYRQVTKNTDISYLTLNDFNFLFDINAERLIAAWGISKGRHSDTREKSRMAGHPLGVGPDYHRGHAIPHSLGGPLDICLVPQLASVNIGPFRRLENLAVSNPGSLYFTYWVYPSPSGCLPITTDQGLLIPGCPPDIRTHQNCFV